MLPSITRTQSCVAELMPDLTECCRAHAESNREFLSTCRCRNRHVFRNTLFSLGCCGHTRGGFVYVFGRSGNSDMCSVTLVYVRREFGNSGVGSGWVLKHAVPSTPFPSPQRNASACPCPDLEASVKRCSVSNVFVDLATMSNLRRDLIR